jgi:cholesterol transport system auxiliary component
MFSLSMQLLSWASRAHWSKYLGLFLTAVLSSCSTLLPEPSPPAQAYLLTPQLPLQEASSPSSLTLVISTPRAAAGYTSSQMAYMRRPYELNYFSRNEWVDTPARMLAPILVNALEASGYFYSVAPSHVRMLADLRLETEILRLVQDFSTQPSEGHLMLQARIIDLNTGQEIASRIFEAREPAPKEEPYGGVVALNEALAGILSELAAFCAQAYPRHLAQEDPRSISRFREPPHRSDPHN